MTKTASVSSFSILLVVAAMAQLSCSVYGLPIQEPETAIAEEAVLQNMAAILSHAAAARNDVDNLARNAADHDRRFHQPVFFGNDPSDAVPPGLLLQTLMEENGVMPGARKSFRVRGEGRPLLKKRTFDSISRNSGFGHGHGSWGSAGRSGSDNLTFTFESLFPAIARGLRSVN